MCYKLEPILNLLLLILIFMNKLLFPKENRFSMHVKKIKDETHYIFETYLLNRFFSY